MANMMDYLTWRGDLSLENDPLNDVDELILAQLSYVSFEDILPNNGDMGSRAVLAEACEAVLARDPEGTQTPQIEYFWENNEKLMRALADSVRFEGITLAGYASELDVDAQTQFGAVTYSINGMTVVAFRGTDNSLAGWKEDLNLSFDSPVPAQTRAARYLERAAAAFPGPLRVCGHSKGGNLAVYAAACCDALVQERLLSVTSFDGPGQDERVTGGAGYARVRERVRLLVPHFSVIGMLLEHEDDYLIVASDGWSLMQHDPFSWQVRGPKFVLEPSPAPQSVAANRVLRQWISEMTPENRRLFSDAVYDLLSASQARTFSEITDHWTDAIRAILKKFSELKPEKRATLERALGGLLSIARDNIRLPWRN